MDADFFRWPDCPPYPPPSWWELRGTELGLDADQIRFAAALVTLGGPDSRSNSMAAQLAGMDLSRTAAFRLARSVKIRKLIDEAEETKKGERKPLTEAEIDQRIDKMIASPNDLAAAKGIELRDRRKAARKELSSDDLLRDRPDLFWAGWLEKLGPKRGPAVVSLLGWYTSSGSKGTDAFQIAPFLDALLP